ncbi:hypothetical protein MA16_Dca004692 [Dendrobium catenatum]|uniref:Uncharacterized protein n=1 Tax=Dendrobium catenatum TaxID=906689 RepID=A0A2I0VNU2_9ASPA|nr:hypothetical protein MA16_Dca004692 [Dendrobium catenatum]
MSFGCSLLGTYVGALLVQREAGEGVGDCIHVKYSLTNKQFLMNLMDKRVDQKKQQPEDCLFHRFFVRHAEHGSSSDAEKIYTKYMRSSSDISSGREEMASTSGIYSEVLEEEFVRDNGSVLSLQPWIFKRAKCSKREEDSCASVCQSFDWGFSHGSPRRIGPSSNCVGSKKRQEERYNFRPITSAENIFMPHLCSKKVSVEEYTFNFHPSPHVKDERLSCLIPISRETIEMRVDSSVEQTENKQDKESGPSISSQKQVSFDQLGNSINKDLTTVIGVPKLPPQKLRKAEKKCKEAMRGSVDTSSSQKICKISNALGSYDGKLLFLLGLVIGVTSSGLSNKCEVEKLKKLLKDNKNLVQDLHEELEMKDSFIVKELGNETDGNKELENYNLEKSLDALQNQNSKWHATDLKMDECMAKVGENAESFSEIEAELEAELERLEQNINAASIGQTTSAFIELDSELIADVVQGELREDLLINGGREYSTDEEDYKDAGTGGTAQPYNSNYSVSPKELTLRLHRVIESRLEERINELESALEQSQMKLKVIEAERSSSKPPFSSSDTESSNQDSLESSKQNESSLRSDLAGDALNAYDEAYEEFIRLAETEDEKLPSSISTIDNKEKAWEQIVWGGGSYEISGTEEEEEEDDDDDDGFDEGKDLIQKIVEKTKQGSPAWLNAQRMLFLMDL